MKYQVMIELQVVGNLDDLPEHAGRLADALYDLHDVVDPDLGGSLASGRLDVTMVVQASDPEDAVSKSMCATRAAVHASGGSTPGWEDAIRTVGTQAREIQDVGALPAGA